MGVGASQGPHTMMAESLVGGPQVLARGVALNPSTTVKTAEARLITVVALLQRDSVFGAAAHGRRVPTEAVQLLRRHVISLAHVWILVPRLLTKWDQVESW